jgi:glycosyltransferase involved in cell wall biosynthesis
MQMKVSVVIITLNEEKMIGKVIDSLFDLSDDIIVVDSGSKDDTVKIAESKGVKVIFNKWKGYSYQKNFGNAQCKHDWILSLDADELLSDELRVEIGQKLKGPLNVSYEINRKTFYMGKLMDYMWQPDFKVRLFNTKNNPVWKGEFVHEFIEVEGSVIRLKNSIIHYSYDDLGDHFTKLVSYSRLASLELRRKGKRAKVSSLLINPISKFISHYVIKRGFMDGYRGLIAAWTSFTYTFLKYAFLFEKNSEVEQ